MRSLVALFSLLLLACSAHSPDLSIKNDPTPSPPPPSIVSDDGGTETPPPVLPSSLRFVGRFDLSDPTVPIASWAGSRIIASFQATAVQFTLTETSFGKGNSQYDLLLDSNLLQSISLQEGTKTYAVNNLDGNPHTIELYRRSEPQISTTAFHGFTFSNGGLIGTPPTAKHSIEFLGDSISVGYGIECSSPNEVYSAATQNERKAFPALMSEHLHADHNNISYSGIGVYWDFDRSNPLTFNLLYPKTLAQSNSLWDFQKFIPELVFINLGSNDWNAALPGALPPTLAAFENKLLALTSLVRGKYLSAEIVLAVSPNLNDTYPAGYNAYTNVSLAIQNILSSLQDGKIHSFEFTRATEADMTGCDAHPNASKHIAMANEAGTFVSSLMGWQL